MVRLLRVLFAALAISVAVVGSEGNQRAEALTIREWSGKGLTPNWSNPANWAGGQIPENGDFLVFGEVLQGVNTTIVNDMVGLSVARLFVRDTVYSISGNSLQVTEVVGIDDGGVAILELPITGATEILVAPASGLVLSGNNTFTGRVDVRGVLSVGSSTALGSPIGITRTTATGQIGINNDVTDVGEERFLIQGDGSAGGLANFGALTIGADQFTIHHLEITESAVIYAAGVVDVPNGLKTLVDNAELELRVGTFRFSGTSDENLTVTLTLGADIVWNSSADVMEIISEPYVPPPGSPPIDPPLYSRVWGGGSFGQTQIRTGEISPRDGNSPTRLTMIDDFYITNAEFSVLLNGPTAATGYSQLVVGDRVLIDSEATLEVELNFDPGDDQDFLILLATLPTTVIEGTFEGLPEGATFNLGNKQWTITYQGGDGNDVVISTVAAAPGDPLPHKRTLPMVARD